MKRVSFRIANNPDTATLKLISLVELYPKLTRNEVVRCICSNSNTRKVIQCPSCLHFQHENCVAKYSLKPIVNYICPECWKFEPLIDSSTTFIVSPPSIKMQWHDEIEKHISNSNFRVRTRLHLICTLMLIRSRPDRFSSITASRIAVGSVRPI